MKKYILLISFIILIIILISLLTFSFLLRNFIFHIICEILLFVIILTISIFYFIKSNHKNDIKIFKKLKLPVFILNNEYTFINFNNPALSFFNRNKNELVNEKIKSFYNNKKMKSNKKINFLDNDNNILLLDLIIDDNEKILQVYFSDIIYNGDKYYLCVGFDFTELHKIKNEKNKYIKISEEKDDVIEHIMYILSHDMRIPLTNIQGFNKAIDYSVQKIFEKIPQDNSTSHIKENEISFYRNYIDRSIQVINNMLTGILEYMQMEISRLNLTKLDVNKIIESQIKNYELDLKNKYIGFQIDNVPPLIGDRVLINQMFSLLIKDFIISKPHCSENNIKIYGKKKNNKITYTFENDCYEISENKIDKIFEIVFKIDDKNEESLKIDFAIIKKIIKRHHGEISIEKIKTGGIKIVMSFHINEIL